MPSVATPGTWSPSAARTTLKVTAVAAGLAFPHAAQAIQTVRRRRPLNTKKGTAETVYPITSLIAIQARPAEFAAIARGHWLIEDRLHRARDVTYDEDRSQVRTAKRPPASWPACATWSSPFCGSPGKPASPPPASPRPPTQPVTANDHELLTDDFAEALPGKRHGSRQRAAVIAPAGPAFASVPQRRNSAGRHRVCFAGGREVRNRAGGGANC
jgi:hypothetical protein